MSSEATEGDQRVTKAYVEAGGDQGLLNLLTDDTVFYVGGYPSSFRVSTWSAVRVCCGDVLSHGGNMTLLFFLLIIYSM